MLDDFEQLASAIDKVTGRKGLGASYVADYMGIENGIHHLKGEIVAFHAGKYFTDEAFLKRLDSHLGIKSDGFFSKIYKWFKGIVSGTNDYETKSFFDAYLKNLDSFLQKERPDIYRKNHGTSCFVKGQG